MSALVAYSVFDCETTGTTPGLDEIVSLAAVRLDADGFETARSARLGLFGGVGVVWHYFAFLEQFNADQPQEQ